MPFVEILNANAAYARHHEALPTGRARLGLAVVTCIDSRIDPLATLGLKPGDAKIIRNAGARVTDDVLRSLIIAAHALGVDRIALVQHTDCGVAANTQASLTDMVESSTGAPVGDLDFLTIDDQAATLRSDAEIVRACPLLPADTEIGAFIFDVRSGLLERVD